MAELMEAIEAAVLAKRRKQPAFEEDLRGRFEVLQPSPRSWLMDLRASAASKPVAELGPAERESPPGADFVLTCESGEALVEALKGKREFMMALARKQLRAQGNMAKLALLKGVLEEIPQASSSSSSSSSSNEDAYPMLVPLPKSEWEPDGPACSQCQAKFSLTNRRHHCRFCGSLCCADCTRFRLGARQKRACMLCHLAVQKARRDYEENQAAGGTGGGGEGDGTHPPYFPGSVYGPDYGVDMTERMLTLESRLGHLERSRRVRKARTLLRCADLVIWTQTASVVLAGALVGHYLASYARLQGWDARAGAWLGEVQQQCHQQQQPGTDSSEDGGAPTEALQHLAAPWLAAAARGAEALLARVDAYWLVLALSVAVAVGVVATTLYRRSVTAFSVAAVLVVAIELTKVRVRRKLAAEAEAVWEEANYIYGAYLRLAFFRLKGSYIKMAQYISSRADIVPDAFSDELSALQDAVPPSSLAEVKPLIERALKAKLSDAFFRFDGEALASASIAQVHRAVLKDGTDVVVKVQHPDVAQLLGIDLRNIRLIFGAIALLEPDYDFTMVAKEWSAEVRKELDFRTEGRNLQRAYEGIVGRSGLDAAVPKPLHASKNVLVMTYCEGVKVTDPRAFPDPATAERDKAAFMKALCEVFAYGCYVQGFYNADPHPGNIFVHTVEDRATGERHVRPVVLDWGLAKQLPERVRVGNAKIVLSVWELDIGGMLDGMEECGMPVDRIDILEDLGNIRFLMRNTAPGEESREASKQFMEAFMEKQKHKPKADRNPLKNMVPEVLFLARVTEMLQGLGAKLGVRVSYLHIMAAGCKRALLERPRPPLPPPSLPNAESTPALSFLDRKVRALLQDLIAEGHGVGAQVVLYKNGRMLVNAAAGLRSRLDPARVTPDTLFCGFSLTKAVLALLAHALVDDRLLSYETRLADVWPELKGTGKDEVTLRQVLTHTAGLEYAFPDKASPQQLWDPKAGEAAVLAATPVKASSSSSNSSSGSKAAMHYYSYGWLLAPVLERASGKPLAELLRDRLLAPLGLDREDGGVILGPVPGTAALPSGDDARLATVEYDLRQMLAEATGMDPSELMSGGGDLGGGMLGMVEGMIDPAALGGEAPAAAFRDLVQRKLAGREFLLDHRMLNGKRLRASGALPSLSGRFTARGLADILEALCRLERSAGGGGSFAQQQFVTKGSSGSSSSGMMIPSAASSPDMNGTSSSSSNGSSSNGNGLRKTPSASSIAASRAAAGAGTAFAGQRASGVLSLARLREMRAGPRDEEPGFTRLVGREHGIKLACGVQLFGFEQPPAPAPGQGDAASVDGGDGSPVVRWGTAYGHAAACGQLALCDPGTGLVLVVTANKAATPGQKNVGYEVLKLVAEELGLGKPLPIW